MIETAERVESRSTLVKKCFAEGLMELVQQEDYNPSKVFNEKCIQWLNKLFSHQELKEFKESFTRTKKNLTTTIEMFPD